ncbi:MAG: hypothetical protein AAF316_00855 [Cyanobacteria bacterium P01_A01_bin.80]
MSATDTALQVINWAMTAQGTLGTPPKGDLSEPEKLAHPSAKIIQALKQLATVTTAQLKWGTPPLGDNRPISADNIIIAAALGTANPQLARTLLKAVSATSCPGDLVTRHGLITPALPFLQDAIADDCRMLSPLTAAFNRPVVGQETQIVNFVSTKLLSNSLAKLSLTLHFAKPTTDIKVRDWRSDLLERLRLGKPEEQSFMIDVYEAGMIYHQQETLNQIKDAYAVITNPQKASDEELLRDALSVANWWKPLWSVERVNLDQLRQRRYLNYAYREGIKLFNLSQKMLGHNNGI